MALGERAAKVERAAVGIAVEPAGAPLHRLQRGRERAPRALVRRELDDAIEAELALDLLLRLPRLVRNQAVECGAEERHGQVSFRSPRLVARALAAPEPEQATDCGDAGRDRALVRALRPLDRAGYDGLRLVLHHRLRADPGEPAEHGVPPVEDAHARRLTSLASGRSRHVPGTVPGTCPRIRLELGRDLRESERPFRGASRLGARASSRGPGSAPGQKGEPPPLRRGGGSGRKRGRRAARPLCGDEGTSLAIEIPDPRKPCAGSPRLESRRSDERLGS